MKRIRLSAAVLLGSMILAQSHFRYNPGYTDAAIMSKELAPERSPNAPDFSPDGAVDLCERLERQHGGKLWDIQYTLAMMRWVHYGQ